MKSKISTKFLLLFLFFIPYFSKSQDFIIKKNGDEIKAKISLVTESNVQYKKHENPKGPTYSIPIEDLNMIKYENGTKDVFNKIEKVNSAAIINTNSSDEVPKGTLIQIKSATKFKGRKARVGNSVQLELAQQLNISNNMVIPISTQIYGTVIERIKPKPIGKGGEISINLDYIDFQNKKIKLNNTVLKVKGANTLAGAIACTIIFLNPLFLLTGGGQANIKTKDVLTVYSN